MADVESMHAGTPHTDGPVEQFPSTGRYDGYRYVSENARGDRRVLHPPRVGDGICERSSASKATSGMTLRAVMKTPADGATR